MTKVIVRTEPADQPDVEALMRLSDNVAAGLYSDGVRQPLNVKTLNSSNIVMLVARTADGSAAGCCALFLKADNTGELKRMIVNPRYRNLGVGKALVTSLCDVAKARGLASIQLEVGVRNIAARSIYENAGFRDRGQFSNHKSSPFSHFMERACV